MTADGPSIKAVLALKYIQPGFPMPTLYFGIANVVANGLIMLRYEYYPQTTGCEAVTNFFSSVVLWVSQNMEDDYTYNLAL